MSEKLCQCTTYGCAGRRSRDKFTQKWTQGVYLTRKTWEGHNAVIDMPHPNCKVDRTVDVAIGEQPDLTPASFTLKDLRNIQDDLQKHRKFFTNPRSLKFMAVPDSSIQFRPRQDIEDPRKCQEPTDLRLTAPENSNYIHFQDHLFMLSSTLKAMTTFDDQSLHIVKEEISSMLSEDHRKLEDLRMQQWELQISTRKSTNQAELLKNINVVKTDQYISPSWLSAKPLALQCWVLLGLFGVVFNVSREIARFTAFMVRQVMLDALNHGNSLNADFNDHIATTSVPLDPETALSYLDLEPKVHSYVCCPKCFAIYPEKYTAEGDQDYPSSCSWQETTSSPVCNSALTTVQNVLGRQHIRPIRRFLLQDMREWLARLISRPGYEEMMDEPLESQFEPAPWIKKSMWDAPRIRNFLGPDGKPFFRYKGPEGRYLFGLFYDHFNPGGNKTAGKQHSVGAIYASCLNLPAHLIFLPENILLFCVVPGPNKPSLTQINRMMAVIVDVFLEFWDPGVWFSSTPKYPHGRLEKVACLPLIADTPAVRQIAGFGAHNSRHFCIWCGLEFSDLDNVDPDTWPKGNTMKDKRAHANEWLKASTLEERGRLFDQHGIRFSELDRLPYRDQIQDSLFDPMHGISGSIERLLRNVFGIDIAKPSGDGLPLPIGETQGPLSTENLHKILELIRDKRIGKLKRCRKLLLQQVCEKFQLRRASNRKTLANELMSYFGDNPAVLSSYFSDANTIPSNVTTFVNINEENEEMSHNIDGGASTDSGLRKEASAGLALIQKNLASGTLEKRLLRMRRSVLADLCRLYSLEESKADTKASLCAKLIQMKEAQMPPPQEHTAVETFDPNLKVAVGTGNPVLGKEVMGELERDAAAMILPSWLVKPPEFWGTTQRGKLKADEWRTIALVLLPVTLIRLWADASQRFQLMLENYIEFVNALRIGYYYTITDDDCDRFRKHWFTFLHGFKQLYPTEALVSNLHNLGHIPDMMAKWGPSVFWRAFPFERYNGILQSIQTNTKFGELELTIMRKFCMGANLKTILSDRRLPASFDALCDRFVSSFGKENYGFDGITDHHRTSDWAESKTLLLDDKMSDLLLECLNQIHAEGPRPLVFTFSLQRPGSHIPLDPRVMVLERTTWRGFSYRPAVGGKHPVLAQDRLAAHPDSHVIILSKNSQRHPYQIQKIFQHRRLLPGTDSPIYDTFLLVARYKSLLPKDIVFDCWRKYESWGSLFYDDFEPSEVVRIDSVVSHFVKTSFSEQDKRNPLTGSRVVHILPVDWVSP